MLFILYVAIGLLVVTVFLLVSTIYLILKKTIYLSDKEKEFIIFVIEIFQQYGDDLGIQSKEQHKKLTDELEKIKKKYTK